MPSIAYKIRFSKDLGSPELEFTLYREDGRQNRAFAIYPVRRSVVHHLDCNSP